MWPTGHIIEAGVRTPIWMVDALAAEIETGSFTLDPALEDIHLNIEARLTERIGEPGRRLHTARSRNDQVATDFKLFVRDAMDRAQALLSALVAVLADTAERHAATVMPGFTHLQAAQPVTFGHHLMAYAEMFMRDVSRFRDARVRLNDCPLGAAALAGTSFPIDRLQTAAELGFDRPARTRSTPSRTVTSPSTTWPLRRSPRSTYRASPRSWSCGRRRNSASSGWPRTLTSGSSIMPQKRNPDAAELVRGKSGRVLGHLQALLVTMKGLPLAYSKDMQEDKEGVFDAVDTIELSLEATAAMLASMRVDPERMRAAAGIGYTPPRPISPTGWCG